MRKNAVELCPLDEEMSVYMQENEFENETN